MTGFLYYITEALNICVSVSIDEFFSAFSQDNRFFLHLPVLWGVTIDGVTEDAINSVLQDAGEKWNAKTNPSNYTKSGNILVAQEVSIPNETSEFTTLESGSGMGGFFPGYGLNARSNFLNRSTAVNFLQTEDDIIHNFFRPWMIAIGIKGLVEYGTTLKSTMTVRQYKNSGEFVRGFRFRKAFPTAVEPFTLNYDNTDFKIQSVTFACTNYEQL